MRKHLPSAPERAMAVITRMREVRGLAGKWPATAMEVREGKFRPGSRPEFAPGMKPSQRLAERARAASVRAFFVKRERAGK